MKGKDTPTVADNPKNKYFSQKIFSEIKRTIEKIWQHLASAVLATSGIIPIF